MASAPFTVNDIVQCSGKTCLITSITSPLGFNKFHLVDIDTGCSFVAYRHQLHHTEIAAALIPNFEGEFDNELDNVIEAIEVDVVEEIEEIDEDLPEAAVPNPRWGAATPAEVERLQANRHSAHTDTQTKWAAAMFRGKCSPNFVLFLRNVPSSNEGAILVFLDKIPQSFIFVEAETGNRKHLLPIPFTTS